jgi:hypothetical protein
MQHGGVKKYPPTFHYTRYRMLRVRKSFENAAGSRQRYDLSGCRLQAQINIIYDKIHLLPQTTNTTGSFEHAYSTVR